MMRIRVPFRAMASEHAITVDAADESVARGAIDAAIADVLRIEAKYSRYRDDSVTSAINRAAGQGAVAIDDETEALLRYAGQCHELSEGRFDITSGVLRRAWDFRRDPPRLCPWWTPKHHTCQQPATRCLRAWRRGCSS